jgi:exo-1,4-beta-D-glucosaminidase
LSAKGDARADFTGLGNLPGVNLNISVSSMQKKGETCSISVTVENQSPSLAFAINPKIIKDSSRELVLPVFWEDNYFSLLPGEKRIVQVEFNMENLEGEKPVVQVEGWNVKTWEKVIRL